MSKPYGRPFRRRKAAALAGQPLCSICGRPILRPQDGTLHHDPPVADGGNAFHERPAHRSCNASHGGKLGAARSGRRRDQGELELPAPGLERPPPLGGGRHPLPSVVAVFRHVRARDEIGVPWAA